jgi:hypothetical protein
MAINFPDNPADGDIATIGGVTYTYTASSNSWKPPSPGASASTLTDLNISDGTSGQLLTTDGNNNFSFTSISSASSTEIFADMAALIAKTGMSAGDQGLVLDNNKLFMYTGSAWYLIATMVNNSPTAITNVDDQYKLTIDGTPTVITAVSTDPEGFPLTWSYAITSGSLGSTATISQTDNVFTITPSTNTADEGEFTLTISATDGGSSGIVNKVTSITLAFKVTNSRYTTLLATAVDTYDNNNIIDSSTNNHSITVNGGAHAGTFSPYRSGGYSTYFDGSGGDYVKSDTHADFAFGTDDFTIECWYYPVSKAQNYTRVWHFGPFWQDNQALAFMDRHPDRSTTFFLSAWNGGEILNSTTTVENNNWYHLVVERSGATITLYVNGVSEDTYSIGTSEFITSTSSYVNIGNVSNGSNLTESAANGHIRDFRYVKGTAIYDGNFTPPTEPLEEVTNTKLLTCHLPYIADGSTNAHAITVVGSVTTQPLSPYDYGEYDPIDNGGSVYFGAYGDYLSSPISSDFAFGTDDFTVDLWFHPTKSTDWRLLIDQVYTSLGIAIWLDVSGTLTFWPAANTGVSQTDPVTFDTWNHAALVRYNGVTRIYLNGVSGAAYSDSNNYTSTAGFKVASDYGPAGYGFIGYMTDVRVVKGTALYTSNFTPPTAPQSSSGASLHIKGTDASIIDKSQGDNLKLIGNTTGSTTVAKFTGSKSMYFDGSGDYISTGSSNLLSMGTGDFTIECWVNKSDTGHRGIWQISSTSGGLQATNYVDTLALGYQIGKWQMYAAGAGVDGPSNSVSANTWYHTAVVRNNGVTKLYIDGTEEISVTDTHNYTGTYLVLGGYYNTSYLHNGYIEDFRITKGLARYTANFTPPTSSLKG